MNTLILEFYHNGGICKNIITKMNNPKVSIIVPVYNVEKYLPCCIDSLLNQTLTEIEIILVDDESPDDCPAMCDEYAKQDTRIKVIHKKNAGQGFARNDGLEVATGEFVAFVDSDDFVDVTMYEKLYNTAKEHNLDIAFCGLKRVRCDNLAILSNFKQVDKLKVFETKEQIKQILLGITGAEVNYSRDREYAISACCAIYSMIIIRENTIRFYSEREFISEDLIFQLDYLPKANRIAYLPDMFYFYRCNPESFSSKFKIGRFEQDKKLFKEIRRKLSLLYNIDDFSIRVDRNFISYARSIVFKGNTKGISKDDVKKEIIRICSDKELEDVLTCFPYCKLPIKQAVLVFLIKYKLINLILIARRFA